MEIYSETNPVPIKYALHLARGISAEVRLPLWRIEEDAADAVRAALLALNQVQAHSDPQPAGSEVGEASSVAYSNEHEILPMVSISTERVCPGRT